MLSTEKLITAFHIDTNITLQLARTQRHWKQHKDTSTENELQIKASERYRTHFW